MLDPIFNKFADLRDCNFIEKRLPHKCFPVKFAKFLRTSILKNICGRVLLKISTLQKKLFIDFFHKIMTFIIITINFEGLKLLLSFCAVYFIFIFILLIYFIKIFVPPFFVNFLLVN